MLLGRDFSLFFVGSTLSAIGTAMVPVALSFALLGAGRSAGALGVVLAAETVPTIALLLLGGVIGDRWPRRRIMIGADLLRFLAESALAFAVIRGAPSMATLIGFAALIGVGNAFFRPASSGLIPQIVNAERLASANGALSGAGSVAVIVGPSLAGLIVVVVGAGWALGVDAATYAASAFCLVLMRLRLSPGPVASARPVLRDLREGLVAFAQRRWLWLLLIQVGLLNMVAFGPFAVMGPLLLAKLPNGARDWGLLLSAIGVGGLAGSMGAMRWRPRRSLVGIEIGVALLVTPLLLLAARAPLTAILAGGVAFGVGSAVLNVLFQTVIQREVPKHVLSRVSSLIQIVAGGLTPVGLMLAGPASAWLGPHRAIAIGACAVLASVVALLCFAEIRQFGAQRAAA